MAATTLTQTVTATPGAASSAGFVVNDNPLVAGATTSSTSTVAIAPVALSQFNPATGILVGARVSATIPVTITTQVYGIGAASGGRTVNGTTTYVGGVSATGVSATSATAALSLSHSCSGNNCVGNDAQNGNNTRTSGAATYTANGTVAPGSLASYYGTNATGVELATAGTLSVSSTGGGALTSAFTRGIVNRTAGSSYSVSYDYLNFSKASFDANTVLTTTTLDFGKVKIGTGPITLNFTLYNIGNANSAGVDLLSLTRDRSSPYFSTTLLPFSGAAGNLDGGQSRTYAVTLNPTVLGLKIDTFRLRMADSAADVGAGLGARQFDLAFSVAALVLPEPGSWATMIVGFGLIGAVMRRRRQFATAA
ncbi:MAG: PEPxxWA-CTERM sorting domain-containing protein [Sandarakinorhabdus sp.]|nr:PEPxxWA-CTERM sorting domain-containing protein [Sandarakinorhabdus sp.]